MKHLKTTGLCLASMLVAGMALAGTAQAQARWEQCTKGAVTGLTKWTSNNCSTASGTGEWQWKEVNNTEEVRVKGSIRLTDTKVPVVGKVSIECSGETVGAVGPGKFGRILEIKTSTAQCRNIENCEAVELIEVRNLPYQGEIFETEGKIEGKTAGGGSGEPGMKVTCKVLGTKMTDECLYVAGGSPEVGSFENQATTTELLVLVTALRVTKQKCTIGGAESGEQAGGGATLLLNGAGLRVS